MNLDENASTRRKAIFRKGLKRTIQDKPFFSLSMEDHIEIEVEWGSLQELNDKSDRWNQILIDRFKEMQDSSLASLGLQEKKINKEGTPSHRLTEEKKADIEDLDFLE